MEGPRRKEHVAGHKSGVKVPGCRLGSRLLHVQPAVEVAADST
jgi:hypothetical protein